MSTTVTAPDRTPQRVTTARRLRPLGRRLLAVQVVLPIAVIAAVLAVLWRFVLPHGAVPAEYVVPQSPQLEAMWGIRFNQVDVVGDGGLVELGYTVLDPEKAGQFQSDTKNPPLLHSEARDATVRISALMKQGHSLRPGQTYFIIYQNSGAALKAGELTSLEYKGITLAHVPVR